MSENVKGIYRIKRPQGMDNDVVVEDLGGNQWQIPEPQYRERGHNPPFEDLPWKDA